MAKKQKESTTFDVQLQSLFVTIKKLGTATDDENQQCPCNSFCSRC